MDIIMYQDNNSDPPSYQTKFALVRALCTNHYFTVFDKTGKIQLNTPIWKDFSWSNRTK